MQYELYSKDKQDFIYYHVTTDNIKTILFYIFNDDSNHSYIIIDNYVVNPINYRRLGFDDMPTEREHRDLIFNCKQNKHIDFYIEQGVPQEKILDLAYQSAKEETDFYFMKLNEYDKNY